ncbi:myelin-oligodendrocyte glycoprotein-like isoform X3 [Petaurus breviceps papuanus]|uniref:myelin-oligodendrocyte glycoprotein-like isoform X3 n=1 Tax=Petaurus breviceps papuanus TaxID=3040969 RepID=UPI0036DD97CE
MHDSVMVIFYLSGSFLSSYMIIFLLLFKKPTLTSGQFSVIGPERLIQAPLGGEAELPCYLSPPQSAQHMEVVWLQSTRVVHLYQDGEDQFGDQAPDYQGRTELVRDAITNGNVTLKIRDVRLLDAGRYKCLIADHFHQEEADMELKVSVYFRRSKPWMGEISGVLVLTCAFEIEMCIFYLWIRHRCRGFYFDETSLWKEWKFAAAIILLLITKLIPIILQTIYFLQQRPCCSTQSVPRADNKVST